MNISPTPTATSAAGTNGAIAQSAGGGLSSLDQNDFLKLMTVQMQHQDPFDPVDQKEMLAQMAQFSSLAGIAEINDTLKAIAVHLDVLSDESVDAGATEQPSQTETREA